MISYIAFNASTLVAKTSSLSPRLAPTLRQQAFRGTSWCSSLQRKRPDNRNPSVRTRINHTAPPKSHPSRPETMMICNGNAATAQNHEISGSITDIEEIHQLAILNKQSTYIDPATDFTVFTELAHLKRGKCCGNQCRHCPYGWSNVRGSTGFNNSAGDDKARAISGDREGTGRLVKRILNGTYYEKDEFFQDEAAHQVSSKESHTNPLNRERCEGETNESAENELSNIAQSQASRPDTMGQGKGGSAGGALTSKNVPYTRKGDTGTSQLFTGERRSKDDVLFEALGTVDELCSIAGVVYAQLNDSLGKRQSIAPTEDATKSSFKTNDTTYGDLPEQLLDIMSRLFDVGSHIAKPVPQNQKRKESTDTNQKREFHPHHAALLEEWIDTMTDQLPELTSFILPTGSPASAQLHVARTVCRRAERRMVPLVRDDGTVDPAALAYVNRLSDYFFTAARFVNYCDDIDEVQYRSEERVKNDEDGKYSKFQRERVVVKLKK